MAIVTSVYQYLDGYTVLYISFLILAMAYNMDSEVAIACFYENGMFFLVLCVLNDDIKTRTEAVISQVGNLKSMEVDPEPYNQYQTNLGHPVQDSSAIAVSGSKVDYQRLLIALMQQKLISSRVLQETNGFISMIQ